MKMLSLFKSATALLVATLISAPAMAGITVLDFGAIQDNCCGDFASLPFPELIDGADPAVVEFLRANAASPNSTSSIGLTDGATITFSDVTAWNNAGDPDPALTNAGTGYFAVRQGATPVGITVTTANPLDLVTIDFVGSEARDASIDFGGLVTNVPVYTVGNGWTNVLTDNVGTATGTFNTGVALADPPEGNLGAARITITPAVTIPEPSSLALLGLGAFGFGLRRRR